MKAHLFSIFSIALIFTGCGSVESKDEIAIKEYNCKIIKTETTGENMIKQIFVQLPGEVSEQELKTIANKLRSENKKYHLLFIDYSLPETAGRSGSWAYAKFNPSLEIKIIEDDKPAEKKGEKVEISDGELVGEWSAIIGRMEYTIAIYKNDGKYKLMQTVQGDSAGEKDLQFSEVNGQSKFEVNNDMNDYYLIQADGNLGVYDDEGFIVEYKKVR